MASFIKITTTANVNTGIGFFINPEKIVSVQSDSGDPMVTFVSVVLPKSDATAPPQVNQLSIEIDTATTPAGEFPVTNAMNTAIETAIATPGVVVDFNFILKNIAVAGVTVTDVTIANP